MARLKKSRENLVETRPLSVALVFFLVLCGLILLIGSFMSVKGEDKAKNALWNVHQAVNALEAHNYGTTRIHLHKAQDALERALGTSQGKDQ